MKFLTKIFFALLGFYMATWDTYKQIDLRVDKYLLCWKIEGNKNFPNTLFEKIFNQSSVIYFFQYYVYNKFNDTEHTLDFFLFFHVKRTQIPAASCENNRTKLRIIIVFVWTEQLVENILQKNEKIYETIFFSTIRNNNPYM